MKTRLRDPLLDIVHARVAPHDGPRGVFEADFRDILESVADELCAVRRDKLDGFAAPDDSISPEMVVL